MMEMMMSCVLLSLICVHFLCSVLICQKIIVARRCLVELGAAGTKGQ